MKGKHDDPIQGDANTEKRSRMAEVRYVIWAPNSDLILVEEHFRVGRGVV